MNDLIGNDKNFQTQILHKAGVNVTKSKSLS